MSVFNEHAAMILKVIPDHLVDILFNGFITFIPLGRKETIKVNDLLLQYSISEQLKQAMIFLAVVTVHLSCVTTSMNVKKEEKRKGE